jgi:hypothetical protein
MPGIFLRLAFRIRSLLAHANSLIPGWRSSTIKLAPSDETVMRNIPKGKKFREKKTNAILPVNFELRHDKNGVLETGISVYQRRLTTPQRIIDLTPDGFKGNIASAVVCRISKYGFIVADVPDENQEPGHAEIQNGKRNLLELSDRQLLCETFTWHTEDAHQLN